jgi:hypothetical protein
MQKPHFDTSMSSTVYYHLHNKTIKIHGHVHSILLVISTTGIKRIEANLIHKNRIVKRWYVVKVASNDRRSDNGCVSKARRATWCNVVQRGATLWNSLQRDTKTKQKKSHKVQYN